jgi:hypothetical protein
MIFKSIRFLFKLILWLVLLLAVIFFVIYAIAPVYDFQEPEPFAGSNIHNPYQDMDSTLWKKGNFHAQSYSWFGITDGRKNSPDGIQAIYQQLGYDIALITDYQRINTYGEGSKNFIPGYEHGYGVRKTHQICLGASKVSWLDYPVYQNINHKQHVLNVLQNHNEIVALAHPFVRDGYLTEDMRLLTNYDLIEAVSHYTISLSHWDAALSAGHPVFIIANDDTHDIFNPTKVGRYCTFVNSPDLEAGAVLQALKTGKAFGARINMLENSDFVQKAKDHKNIPVIKSVEVRSDTLFVEVSKKASAFTFIGYNGMIKKSAANSVEAFYPIAPDDKYIRTEIIFDDNTQFYLNPVIRYRGDAPSRPKPAEVNFMKTWMQRIIAAIIAIIIFIVVVKILRPAKKKGHISRRQYYWE